MTLEERDSSRRVGVVTIIDHGNYGNRLQNYAMQRIIDGLGFACTTIVNYPRPLDEARQGAARPRSRRLRRGRGSGGSRGGSSGGRSERDRALAKRLRGEKRANGLAFTRAHIRETDFTLYRDTPAGQVDAMYDYFVAGSDQVWNPNFRKLSEVDFLTFASRRKRIAFSASIGVPEHPRRVPRLLSRAPERLRAHLGAGGGGRGGGARADRARGAGDDRPDADARGARTGPRSRGGTRSSRREVPAHLFPRPALGGLPGFIDAARRGRARASCI